VVTNLEGKSRDANPFRKGKKEAQSVRARQETRGINRVKDAVGRSRGKEGNSPRPGKKFRRPSVYSERCGSCNLSRKKVKRRKEETKERRKGGRRGGCGDKNAVV